MPRLTTETARKGPFPNAVIEFNDGSRFVFTDSVHVSAALINKAVERYAAESMDSFLDTEKLDTYQREEINVIATHGDQRCLARTSNGAPWAMPCCLDSGHDGPCSSNGNGATK